MDARRILTANWDFAGDTSGLVTVTKGEVKNIDFKIVEDRWLNGGEIITEDAVIGDTVKAQVVDIDGIIPNDGSRDPFPNYPILKEWVHGWSIDPKKSASIITPYAALVIAGVWLRIIYTSIGTTNDVKVAINYDLHKDPA